MAIKPILFNTEMVRAILSGQKTCTRRVVKGAEHYTSFIDLDDDLCVIQVDRYGIEREKPVTGLYATFEWDGMPEFPTVKAPYRPGDILYVRETWAPWSRTEGIAPTLHYRADKENLPGVKWRPSIHMPKEAARIFLRVTDVRVERLQEITTVGLQDEGILPPGYLSQFAVMTADCFEQWKNLWDSTIKPADRDRYGWAANPWVWVIEFERISREAALGGDEDD